MRAGDLCAVEWDEGDYRAVKILAIEDGIVHVRLYADKFVERPFQVDPAQLDLGMIHKSLGIAHLPVSAEDFAAWLPGVVGHEAVQSEELAEYELWRQDQDARGRLLGRR
jgi:hypothetical protein